MTITGANFVNGATVSIGGVAATGVSFVNATTLTATTGAHATGTVNVVVTNPDAQTGTLTNGYFYAPPPSSTRFYTLTPCRVLDTRNAERASGWPGAERERRPARSSRSPVPAAFPRRRRSVSVEPHRDPAGGGRKPDASIPETASRPARRAISFAAGQTRANNAILYLATDGTGSIGVENDSVGSVHFILDVNGYFQ